LSLARRKRPAVGTTPADAVHRENKWTLLRYRARTEGIAHRTPILLVPSLINRHYVLDLQKGKSFVEFLVARGHDVFIINWGTPGPEDRFLEFDEICDRYIGRAVRKAARLAGTEQVHLLGYCLGGTLTAIYTAARPERVASLVALAAPIRFADAGIMAEWVRSPGFDVRTLVSACGNVPWPLMQATFQMLQPTLNLAKTVGLIDRAWDDEFLDSFLALETWGHDNVSFPGAAYQRYIEDLYRDDKLVRGELLLSGRPARLDAITCPTLAVTFEHDHIVPTSCAAVLLDHVSSTDTEHIHLNGGHVGAVVSRKAASGLWPQMSDWWIEREQRVARRPSISVVHPTP
jgi:polyhydroxyalkanoate synthase